jgi:PAS domain S-box-containing protein
MGLQTSTRDVRETKRAVDALRAAREHFRHAFDDAPIGMSIVSLKGRFERVNQALCELLGYSEQELLTLGPTDLTHPDDRAREADLVRELLNGTRRSFAIEKRHIRRDGRPVWVRVTVSLMRDMPGDAEPRLLGHVEDVSESRSAAQALQSAREAAERANQAKSEFLSRMSHELRTPLNAVLGFAQLLQADDLTETQAESVERITSGGRHLLELVNDVLDIATIEAGELPIAIERVSTRDVAHETLELLAPLAAVGDVSLTCDVADADVVVRGNRQRLKQVLLNLDSNAIKYSPSGSCVTVAVERDQARGRLRVSDNGPGIAPEHLARAFVPFERIGADSAVEGTGLGLPLSRNLVHAMGGTIAADSDSGGSMFTVELPLVTGAGELPGPRPEPAGARELASPGREGSRRVLYIEDNPASVELVARIVDQHDDIELVAVGRGEDGLELALRDPPDAVVVDLHLPDMSGATVVEALCADRRTAAIPVIVVTADVTKNHEQRVLAAGAAAYLTKPFDLGEFEVALGRAIAGGKAGSRRG